jgi:hypothetical protein
MAFCLKLLVRSRSLNLCACAVSVRFAQITDMASCTHDMTARDEYSICIVPVEQADCMILQEQTLARNGLRNFDMRRKGTYLFSRLDTPWSLGGRIGTVLEVDRFGNVSKVNLQSRLDTL